MPVYTYRCENCGVQFERTQKFADQPLVRCPECGKKSLRKVYTPVGIVFKGSGFYATDHRSPSGMTSMRSDEKAEKAAESAANSTTSKKDAEPKKTPPSESKPAASAPAASTATPATNKE
jgi:putative FmdB family regulatory protein